MYKGHSGRTDAEMMVLALLTCRPSPQGAGLAAG